MPTTPKTTTSQPRPRAVAGPSPAPQPDHGENSASTVVEAPQKAPRNRLDAHDFPDGGGSGGAQAYSRKRLRR